MSTPGRPKGETLRAQPEGTPVSTTSKPAVERVKVALGLLLGLGIGALCRFLAIPSPAPPVLPGALLVVAMTLGYIAADRWLCRRQALHAHLCGGPDGGTKSSAQRCEPTQ